MSNIFTIKRLFYITIFLAAFNLTLCAIDVITGRVDRWTVWSALYVGTVIGWLDGFFTCSKSPAKKDGAA
jgi:uncharacterized membrane protein YczE